jgi:SET domain-containing protein
LPSRRVVVRRSAIHGRGLFASAPIAQGDVIINYAGELITEEEADERYQSRPDGHTFFFDLGNGLIIDGGSGGNSSRWINHSCLPNVVAHIEGETVLIVAARDIEPGQELLLDYQLVLPEGHSDEERAWYACSCGALGCRQTMLTA